MMFTDISGLSTLQRKALDEARKVMDRSYSPYSKFPVGAALYNDNFQFVTGTNVENASYGLTNCAERSAVFNAFSSGMKTVKGVAIIGGGEYFDLDEITGPCGACRQVLFEFAQLLGKGNVEVIISSFSMDNIGVSSIRELLPFPFGPKNLGIGIIKE